MSDTKSMVVSMMANRAIRYPLVYLAGAFVSGLVYAKMNQRKKLEDGDVRVLAALWPLTAPLSIGCVLLGFSYAAGDRMGAAGLWLSKKI